MYWQAGLPARALAPRRSSAVHDERFLKRSPPLRRSQIVDRRDRRGTVSREQAIRATFPAGLSRFDDE